MATVTIPTEPDTDLPDHTQLPDTDGSIVQNFQEHPQSLLLTESIFPLLEARHPDRQFAIGLDAGIFWTPTTPPLLGCKAPDWFYIPGVPPLLDGVVRRSYVMWREVIAPLIILEYVSGSGAEERDRTPRRGKFWVYEQGIRTPYYGIYEVDPGQVEVYRLVDNRYELLEPNARGHFPIAPLGVELGIWQGWFMNLELPWLRWWDATGRLLPCREEAIAQERQRVQAAEQRAENAEQRAESAEQRVERLAAKLRELGGNPESL